MLMREKVVHPSQKFFFEWVFALGARNDFHTKILHVKSLPVATRPVTTVLQLGRF
jgi:hypothetical protein